MDEIMDGEHPLNDRLSEDARRAMDKRPEGETMTHIEILRKLIGRVNPTGDHGEDQKRLANLRTMGGVLLDLLEDIVDAAKCVDSEAASVRAIGKYASDTIGIVNENTGAWDKIAQLEAIVDGYPKTEDGVYIRPGDTVWDILDEEDVTEYCVASVKFFAGGRFEVDLGNEYARYELDRGRILYSSPEAAEAALEAKP